MFSLIHFNNTQIVTRLMVQLINQNRNLLFYLIYSHNADSNIISTPLCKLCLLCNYTDKTLGL